MALPHKSLAIESSIEFLNLQPLDISPFISECDIKVCYVGPNRNQIVIEKDVLAEAAKTLRGCPIVGYYKEDAKDFADHGEQVIFDGDGIHFNILTRPYGFVAPNAAVWFQDFMEEDEVAGEPVRRTYLCVKGYLWTGQFKEAAQIVEDGGKPQSLEFQRESMQGYWSKEINDQVEFFILSDAIFQKLCILGDNVEPCFEGSSIVPTQESMNKFTVNHEYKQTLFSMMNELKFALKGEPSMEDNKMVETEEQKQQPEVEAKFSAENQDKNVESSVAKSQENIETKEVPASEFKQDDKKEEKEDPEQKEDVKEKQEDNEDDKKKVPNKASLETEYQKLQSQFTEMQKSYDELKANFESLAQFKNSVEDAKKDELIAKFYMLSDEDKKDIIENKSKYTYNEIEEKLAVIGFKKGVNFSQTPDTSKKNDNQGTVTFNLKSVGAEGTSLPEWIQAVKDAEKQM